MRVTIKDIAVRCNKSVGTVDRALNARPGINEETRKRILDTAVELKYTPNRVAQSLAIGKSKTIGIICFDLCNNCFASLVDIIAEQAKKNGYYVSLILTHRSLERELEGIQYLYERRVDGIIIFPVGQGPDYVAYLKSLDIPIVSLYNKISDDFPHVGVDDSQAMADAVRFITGKGYQKIVFLSPPIFKPEKNGINVFTLRQRYEGYVAGLSASGLGHAPTIIEGHDFKQARMQIETGRRTAFLCISDTYALQAIRYLDGKGLVIPDDYGIMGYDNIEMLQYIKPQLTTIEYHNDEMGIRIFKTVFAMIHGKKVSNELLMPYSIIERETI